MGDKRRGGDRGAGNEGRAGRADQSSTRVHGIIIVTPRDFVIPALFLSPRVEYLALHLIGAEVCEAYKGFGELEKVRSSVNKIIRLATCSEWVLTNGPSGVSSSPPIVEGSAFLACSKN